MTSPIRTLLGGTFERANKNGQGYELFLPQKPRGFEEVNEEVSDIILFEEAKDVIHGLHEAVHKSLLVYGEPGSGKSHLVDDITMAKAALRRVPYLRVSVHINGGKKDGASILREKFKRIQQKGGDDNLIVLDNLDYLAYRGKSRTRGSATEYAQAVSDIVEEMVESATTTILGIAHDEAWRAGRWTWGDPGIDEPAKRTLNYFVDKYRFQGDLTEEGLEEIASIRNLGSDFIDTLAKDGLQTFFVAMHVDFDLYKQDPRAAVDRIEEGRRERKFSK